MRQASLRWVTSHLIGFLAFAPSIKKIRSSCLLPMFSLVINTRSLNNFSCSRLLSKVISILRDLKHFPIIVTPMRAPVDFRPNFVACFRIISSDTHGIFPWISVIKCQHRGVHRTSWSLRRDSTGSRIQACH